MSTTLSIDLRAIEEAKYGSNREDYTKWAYDLASGTWVAEEKVPKHTPLITKLEP